jgi:hypothetical protein
MRGPVSESESDASIRLDRGDGVESLVFGGATLAIAKKYGASREHSRIIPGYAEHKAGTVSSNQPKYFMLPASGLGVRLLKYIMLAMIHEFTHKPSEINE